MIPVKGSPPRYHFYIQGLVLTASLQEDLQAGLEENPHYRYACGLGQLGPVEICQLPDDVEEGWQLYERGCLAHGQKLGNIKPVTLDPRLGWEKIFDVQTMTQNGSEPEM